MLFVKNEEKTCEIENAQKEISDFHGDILQLENMPGQTEWP